MVDLDKQRFTELMQALGTTLGGRELSKPMLLGYWIALRDLPLEQFSGAVEKALGTCKILPAPVELLQLAGAMSTTMRVVLAWNALKTGIRKAGSWQSITFDDPAVNATIRSLGGWARLCAMESEELDKWLRRDFEKTYAAFVDHGVSAELAAPLAGAFEIANNAQGYEVAPPVQIATGVPAARLLGPMAAPGADRAKLANVVADIVKGQGT